MRSELRSPLRTQLRSQLRVIAIGGGLALAAAVALLLAPPLGTDLSAQVARADFFRQYGLTPVDLRWYGGTVQYGYSWVSPAVMGVLGTVPAGAVALVASTLALAVLLVRTGAQRPLAGTVLGVAGFAGNLVSGRVTFALGVAAGLWGLAALTVRAPGWLRLGLAAAGALLASATSPVAGLFAGLAGAALVLSGRWRDGLAVGTGASVPLLVTAVLASDGGVMNISRSDTVHATLTGLVVALLVRGRVLRIGALLASAAVLGAYLVPSPVGLNATRLPTMFALPLLAAYAGKPARVRPERLAHALRRCPAGVYAGVLVLAVALWQPPIIRSDLADAGNPTATRAYFQPLVRELQRRRPVGRVEVLPTRDYWEAVYVADAVPLARGWLRQVDTTRNPLFFTGRLEPAEYRSWLVDNGVAYVAVPDARLSWVGRREAEVIARRPGYLREVWRDAHWTLYEVDGAPSIVDGATLVSVTGSAVTVDVAAAGEVLLRVRPSRWLRVRGPAPGRLRPADRWTVLRVDAPGRYTVTS